jgi:EAL domain-containing protein (putative c-di-GMP-specific phosphodiesterase class I)
VIRFYARRCSGVDINRIAHAMNLETLAEFVEDETILEKLREMGVDYA